ncbi:FCD domain-containing protein [Sphingomonas sp. RB3P16]|uniref:FadR/GntR family transcriptional regulator n=1 Tax=Parasphingomonas frigoris TaxID=3096163 RepID=UPI002FCA1CA0
MIDTAPRPDASGRKTGTITAHIVHEIGRAIVTQYYSESIAFPVEAEIARQYGASRSIVREAVKMLAAKGLVRSRQRAGTAVQPESEWNLLDTDVLKWLLERDFSIDLLIEFTDIRMAIEPRAASLAASYASGAQRRDIMQATSRMFAAEKGEDDALEADIAFHTAVLNASNNRFLRQFTDLSETTLRFSIRRTNAYAGVARASASDHQRVAKAIVEGDPVTAGQLMNALIQGALDLLLAAGGHPAR